MINAVVLYVLLDILIVLPECASPQSRFDSPFVHGQSCLKNNNSCPGFHSVISIQPHTLGLCSGGVKVTHV